MLSSKRSHALAFALALVAVLLGTDLRAQKTCCKVIRVDAEKGFVWLRNPASAVMVQINAGPGNIDTYKVDDQFNPATNKQHVFVLPVLPEPNATIVRARGAEIAGKLDESGKVYRFYAVRFGALLSSIRPGQKILIDEAAKLAIIRYGSADGKRGGVKPQVFAFELD